MSEVGQKDENALYEIGTVRLQLSDIQDMLDEIDKLPNGGNVTVWTIGCVRHCLWASLLFATVLVCVMATIALGNDVDSLLPALCYKLPTTTTTTTTTTHEFLPVTLVTVCENMSDLLKASLSWNADHVNRIIVVTSPEDKATAALCRRWAPKVACHITLALHQNGDAFNKGKALNEVQTSLHANPQMHGTFVLLLDPDICIPEGLWAQFPAAPSDKVLYSATARCIYMTPQEANQGKPSTIETNPYLTMGYFQLYKVSPYSPKYETGFRDASYSDLDFGRMFPSHSRVPGYVHHLGHRYRWTGSGLAQNWSAVEIPRQNDCP